MTAVRQQLAMLALFVAAGLAVASPVSRTASLLVVALGLAGVGASVLVGHYGARSVAFGCLIAAAFLAPMNNVRLGSAVTFADLFLVPAGLLAFVARSRPPDEASGERRSMRPDVLAALLLLAGGVVGSQFAVDLGSSFAAIMRFGLAAIGVPLVFVALAPDRKELRALAWAFIIGASLNAIIGIITYHPFDRGIGLSTHSNHLALGCVLASGFAAALFLSGTGRTAHAAAACWGILTLGVLKSGSRAGAIGAIVLIAIILFTTASPRLIRWCVAVLVAVGTLLQLGIISFDNQNAIARLLGRDRSTVEMSNLGRAQLRAEAIAAIKKHPLTGAGFEEARVAHNLYLQVWGAAGIVGLLGMTVLWNASVRAVFRGAAGDRFLLGVAAGAVGYLVLAVASNILWDRYLWLVLAVFVTAWSQARTADAHEQARPTGLVVPSA